MPERTAVSGSLRGRFFPQEVSRRAGAWLGAREVLTVWLSENSSSRTGSNARLPSRRTLAVSGLCRGASVFFGAATGGGNRSARNPHHAKLRKVRLILRISLCRSSSSFPGSSCRGSLGTSCLCVIWHRPPITSRSPSPSSSSRLTLPELSEPVAWPVPVPSCPKTTTKTMRPEAGGKSVRCSRDSLPVVLGRSVDGGPRTGSRPAPRARAHACHRGADRSNAPRDTN